MLSVVGGSPADEKKAYDQAFGMLRDGSYKEAIAAFQAQLKRFPSGDYADNAWYWMGESYYVNRDFKPALDAFQKVVSDFPRSQKVLGAMLKIGYIRDMQKDWAGAREILQQVKSRSPGSREARLAETRLQQMQSQGH